jgi:hypothetical protein
MGTRLGGAITAEEIDVSEQAKTQSTSKATKAPAKERAKVITKEQADQVKRAFSALPQLLADNPQDAMKAAETIVGVTIDANPARLTNLGIPTVDAASLAHGAMTPVQLLGKFGVGRASEAQKAQCTANLAELVERAPKQVVKAPATQHKLSDAKRAAEKKAAEDPKVGERRATLDKRHEEFAREAGKTADGEKRPATEKEKAALELAEKKWIAAGTVWSGNGYRSGASGLDPKGESCYVFVDDDGQGWLMQKSPDRSRWVMDLLGFAGDAAVVLLIDEPAGHKSYYGVLEAWGAGYSREHDKRQKAAIAAEKKAAEEPKTEQSEGTPEPVKEPVGATA